jgi:hypothetical protein
MPTRRHCHASCRHCCVSIIVSAVTIAMPSVVRRCPPVMSAVVHLSCQPLSTCRISCHRCHASHPLPFCAHPLLHQLLASSCHLSPLPCAPVTSTREAQGDDAASVAVDVSHEALELALLKEGSADGRGRMLGGFLNNYIDMFIVSIRMYKNSGKVKVSKVSKVQRKSSESLESISKRPHKKVKT